MRDLPHDLIQTRWSLIQRLKNRQDEESWREFFETYWRLIYSVASKSGLTHAEAEDVVQETVVSVSRKIHDFRADPAAGSFKSWLLTLARWRIGDQFRKRPRFEPLRQPSPGETSTGTEPVVVSAGRFADPPESVLDSIWEEEWRQNLIETALESLKAQVKPKHFQIFYLLTIEEMPPSKVAQALRVNIGQVYLVRHRVSRQFTKAIKEAEARLR